MSAFESLLRRANTLSRSAQDSLHEPAWWAGYVRGLRRAHHGEAFDTPAAHDQWLSYAESSDPDRAALGRGYRAGLTLTAREPD